MIVRFELIYLLAAKITTKEHEHRLQELKLAMAWNKFDRIQHTILTDNTIMKWTVCSISLWRII